ncbi:MAG: sulfurtransferase [Drouetiella hepatica Uher 2000/2452]|jgi:thiosulfate/3-mercaptopyruvate sulfurtransferase|uniref:Sulfurtransferase n=1 Tax=Drouetiella hepatica Uher 2000/2452 TaxID=904376 RepID=A0A951Q842_9CYAN|nr:sulfurtransferase [Drouetiella hepatica Uher 2000/2452]
MNKSVNSSGIYYDISQESVISAMWLYENLQDSQGVIIDCRFSLAEPDLGQRQYQCSHIPGAHYFDLNQDLSSPVGQEGGRHPLPDLAQLAEKLSSVGVNFEEADAESDRFSWVVVYDDSRFGFAARLWWLLRYMGFDRVAVLDGGWSGWVAANYPVTDAVPLSKAKASRAKTTGSEISRLVPQTRSHWVVDREAVKSRKDLPGVVLVDSREGERYRGEREPIDPIAGHIPGAVNYPWQEVTDAQGYCKPVFEQQQRWAALSEAEEILVYCGSGVTACVNLLSLAIAGIDTGKLYVGGWSDWCSRL